MIARDFVFYLAPVILVPLEACTSHCSDVACANRLEIVVDPGQTLAAGDYSIETVTAAGTVSCALQLGADGLMPGQSKAATCPGGPVDVLLTVSGGGGGCSVGASDPTCMRYDASTWPVFRIGIDGNPDHIQVVIHRDGAQLYDGTLNPAYRETAGGSCGGTCRVGSEQITL